MSISMSDDDLLAEGFREEFLGVWSSPLAQEISEESGASAEYWFFDDCCYIGSSDI